MEVKNNVTTTTTTTTTKKLKWRNGKNKIKFNEKETNKTLHPQTKS